MKPYLNMTVPSLVLLLPWILSLDASHPQSQRSSPSGGSKPSTDSDGGPSVAAERRSGDPVTTDSKFEKNVIGGNAVGTIINNYFQQAASAFPDRPSGGSYNPSLSEKFYQVMTGLSLAPFCISVLASLIIFYIVWRYRSRNASHHQIRRQSSTVSGHKSSINVPDVRTSEKISLLPFCLRAFSETDRDWRSIPCELPLKAAPTVGEVRLAAAKFLNRNPNRVKLERRIARGGSLVHVCDAQEHYVDPYNSPAAVFGDAEGRFFTRDDVGEWPKDFDWPILSDDEPFLMVPGCRSAVVIREWD